MFYARLLLLGFFLSVLSPMAFAEAEKGCLGGEGEQSVQIRGFSIKAFRHPRADEEKFLDECLAEITDATGKRVFSEEDHGLEILPISGTDLNDDGEPEAVIEGYSGGAHCCWTYWIVSLGESPGLLARIYNERGISFEKVEQHAGITLVTQDGRFDYFDDMCHACSPFPSVYLRFEHSRLEDVSAEFWSEYRKGIEKAREELSSAELSEFRSQWRKHQKGGLNTFEEIRGLVLNVALGYLYAGKPEDAWKTLEEMWPGDDLQRIKKLVLKTRGKGFVAWAQDPSNFDD